MFVCVFQATPHRGSAYRCLQTKHGKDPVLKSIAERSCLPLHRYLPAIFTIWIDPGEVAVCFGDEGTWCPLYNHDVDEYSDGEETVSSLSSDDDLNQKQTQSTNSLDSNPTHSSTSSLGDNNSRTSSPFFNAISSHNSTNSMPISWPQ